MGEPIVSVIDLGAYLRRDLGSDALAVIAVNAASDAVRGYLGQALDYALNETITLNGSGTDALLLPEVPVIDVTEVKVGGVEVTDWVPGGPETGTLYRTGVSIFTDPVTGAALPAPGTWPRGRQNVEVTYTHGYVTQLPLGSGSGSGGGLTDLPDDVRMVALEVAARIWDQGLVRQETIAGYQVSYSSAAGAGLTPTERAILDRRKTDRV